MQGGFTRVPVIKDQQTIGKQVNLPVLWADWLFTRVTLMQEGNQGKCSP
jgi:hypothetical protein